MVLSPKFASAFAAVNRTLTSLGDTYALVPTSAATSGRGAGETADPLASWQLALQSGSLAVVCVLSVVGNFLVAFSLVKKDQLVLPSNRLVFNLTGANFVFSLLVLPFVVASVAEQKWLFGIFWCNFTAFLTILFGIASILTLAMIAIDRYYAIVKPMMYTMTITTSKSTAMLLWVWIQACVCSLPPLFGWSRFEYSPAKSVCTVDWSDSAPYTAFLLATSVLLPFAVMATCYYQIFQVARTKCRKIHVGTVTTPTGEPEVVVAPPATNPTSPAIVPPVVEPPVGSARLQPKVHRLSLPKRPSWALLSYNSMAKGIRTICVVVGAFLLTWLPYIVMAAAEATLAPSTVPRWYLITANWLMYASTVGYPVVYGLYNRAIRKEMRACLCPAGGSARRAAERGLPQRRNSRRLSLSGSLLDYSPFRARHSNGGVAKRASVELQAGSLRKASQDSGAIMTESDLEPDLSFLPVYWFGRHSASAAAKLQQFSHRMSHRLRDRSSSVTAATTSGLVTSGLPIPPSSLNIQEAGRNDPQYDRSPDCRVIVHMGMDDEASDAATGNENNPGSVPGSGNRTKYNIGDEPGSCYTTSVKSRSTIGAGNAPGNGIGPGNATGSGKRTGNAPGSGSKVGGNGLGYEIPTIPSIEANVGDDVTVFGQQKRLSETVVSFAARQGRVDATKDELAFEAFQTRPGGGCRGESIDEGIVNDCVLEDVD